MKPYITTVRIKRDCFLLFFVNTRQHILARIGNCSEISEPMRNSVSHVLLSSKIETDPEEEKQIFLKTKTPRGYIGGRAELAKLSFLTPRNSFVPINPNFISSSEQNLSVKRNDQVSLAKVLIYKNGNLVIQIDDETHFDLFKEMNKSWNDLSRSVALQTLNQFESILYPDTNSLFDVNRNKEELAKVNQDLENHNIEPESTYLTINVRGSEYNLKLVNARDEDTGPGVHAFSDNSVGVILPEPMDIGDLYDLKIVSAENTREKFDLKLFCVDDLGNGKFLNRLHPRQSSESLTKYFQIIEALNRYYIINHLLDLSQ